MEIHFSGNCDMTLARNLRVVKIIVALLRPDHVADCVWLAVARSDQVGVIGTRSEFAERRAVQWVICGFIFYQIFPRRRVGGADNAITDERVALDHAAEF